MKRILVVLAVGLLALVQAPLARGGTRDLRWGGDAEGGAPYVFPDPRNPQKIIGFEVDLANALGQRLNRPAVFVQNQWEGLIPGLERGDYDIVLNGLEITEDRKREINFTIPYYATSEQLSIRKDSPAIPSLAELKGKAVGTLKFSFAERVLRREGGINLRTYDGQINAYEDLANGRLDAVLMDWPIALYYSKPNPELKFTGSPISRIQYGIGVRQDDKGLLTQLNAALTDLIQSGELKNIYEKWGLWNSETETLFAQVGANPKAYEDYTQSVTRKLTWSARLKQYAGYLPLLLGKGAPMTLLISILGMALAVTLGLMLALTNLYGPFVPARSARAFIEVMRGTPLLIQLYLIFYGLPSVGIRLSPLIAAIVGLGLNYAAYEAENYRGAIQAIPRAQMEAALSLGMTRAQALQHVILPQAIRLAIPPVTNDFISLFKDSSIVSVITMVELTKVYGELASTYYDYIGVGILTAAIYFLLGLPFVRLARWAEEKLAFDKATPSPLKRRWFDVGAKPAVG
jgi:polar amino acid transport system substrate-binding protein